MQVVDLPNKFQTYLEPHLPFYLDLLRQMVAINSFTVNPVGVNTLGKMTAGLFAELGFQAETVQAANPNFGRHLVLTRRGRTKRKIGLISHLDTVYSPEEEARNNFAWRREGDRIYGPGTVDIKGGTVVIYMLLDVLRKVVPDVFDEVSWYVLLNAAEEQLALDFSQVCLQKLSGDALGALVFEGGWFNRKSFLLVVSRKGRANYHVKVHGRGGHAGNAHQTGANAIIQLADTIQEIAKLTDYKNHLTFNVGVASGGTVTNRIPHYAEAEVEMRAFSEEAFRHGVESMLALNGRTTVTSHQGHYPCHVEVVLLDQNVPWPRNPATDSLFDLWQEAAHMMGMQVVRQSRGGLSDGNLVWHKIPTLDALGPAGGNAHCSERSLDGKKDQEYALASSFLPKTILNALAACKLIDK